MLFYVKNTKEQFDRQNSDFFIYFFFLEKNSLVILNELLAKHFAYLCMRHSVFL